MSANIINTPSGWKAYEAHILLKSAKKSIEDKELELEKKVNGLSGKTFQYIADPCGHDPVPKGVDCCHCDKNCCMCCNRYSLVTHPVFWGGLVAGIITSIATKSFTGFEITMGTSLVSTALYSLRYFLAKRQYNKEIDGFDEQLGKIERLQTMIPLMDSSELFDLEKGRNIISFLGNKEITEFNLQQLYGLYKLAPDVFWKAFDDNIIDDDARLFIYKLHQFLQADASQLIEALSDQTNIDLLNQQQFIFEKLIQNVRKEVWEDEQVQALFHRKIAFILKKPVDDKTINSLLQLTREGTSIAVVEKKFESLKLNSENQDVKFVIGTDNIKVNKNWLSEESEVFKAMLNNFTEKNQAEITLKDVDFSSFKHLVEQLKLKQPLEMSIENWMSLYVTADYWKFEEAMTNLLNWANLNEDKIANSEALEEFATFYKTMSLNNLFQKLDLAYSCVLKGKELSFTQFNELSEKIQKMGFSQSRKQLYEDYYKKFINWLKKDPDPSTTTNQIAEKLHLYLLNLQDHKESIVKEVHDFIIKRSSKEKGLENPKLLTALWDLATKENNDLLKQIVAKFCNDEENSTICHFAWISIPKELRQLMSEV